MSPGSENKSVFGHFFSNEPVNFNKCGKIKSEVWQPKKATFLLMATHFRKDLSGLLIVHLLLKSFLTFDFCVSYLHLHLQLALLFMNFRGGKINTKLGMIHCLTSFKSRLGAW